MALRKCSRCGLEAHTDAELEQFTTCRSCKHGKRNLCKACNNARNKEYYQDHHETRLQAFKTWRKINPDYSKEHGKKWRLENLEHVKAYEKERGLRTIRFKGKPIRYQENPRTNICQLCKRKYPEELKRQTCIHHVIYNEEDPLAWTLELCVSCHMKIHNTNRKK